MFEEAKGFLEKAKKTVVEETTEISEKISEKIPDKLKDEVKVVKDKALDIKDKIEDAF